MSTSIVWYKVSDLRLHDHKPLYTAHQTHDSVAHVFVFDPRWFAKTPFGFPKTGYHRTRFMREAVADLHMSLKAKGSDLIIYHGKPEDQIPQLAQELNAKAVLSHSEICAEELAVDKAVRNQLSRLRNPPKWTQFWGNTMYDLHDLPFDPKSPEMPDIYTHFRKSVERDCRVTAPLPVPATMKPHPELAATVKGIACPTLETLGVEVPGIVAASKPAASASSEGRAIAEYLGHPVGCADSRSVLPFVGGETAALARMKHYFWDTDCLQSYKETRNGLLGGDYSSKFSPWLAFGNISPKLIHQQVKEYERTRVANKSTYWLLFELIWRDFFRFASLKWGNKLFFLHGPRDQDPGIPWTRSKPLTETWTTGTTGYPFVDANMRELAATGFMSNRGRQNVASFFVKDLEIDWRVGAEYFESQLLDYDPCSNYGNWTYVAGVGSDPRENRYFSIPKQSKNYDPEGEYMRFWCPELQHVRADQLQNAERMNADDRGEYPPPVVRLMMHRKPLKGKGGGGGGGGAVGRGRGGRSGDIRKFAVKDEIRSKRKASARGKVQHFQ